MSKKDPKKLLRKRRKERERQRERAQTTALAYHGKKFQTEELVPIHLQTELAICEAFVMSGRRLTDHDIRHTLEGLISGIRNGTVEVLREDSGRAQGTAIDLLVWNVRHRWQEFFRENPYPGRDKMVGVLRTILGSIEVRGSIDPVSRGYLYFVQDFMQNQLGVNMKLVSEEVAKEALPDEESESDEESEFAWRLLEGGAPESELLTAGRAWIHDRNMDAAAVFRTLADQLILSGELHEVDEVCRHLMHETQDRELITELWRYCERVGQRLPAP